MKRRYKLLIIIIISGVLAFLIFLNNRNNKINIVVLGDAVSSGELSYRIDGISYNDYIKEYFANKKLLKSYNDYFSYQGNNLTKLITDIDKNNKLIKQDLNQSNLITICIGEEELTKFAITKDLNKESIDNYLKSYDFLLNNIKKISEGKIIIISLYENKYLNKRDIILINSELSNIANKYDSIFININDLEKDYLNKDGYYFNYKTHKIISDMIINSI